jgi:hypothetical protein
MKHQTQIVESEITIASNNGAGCATFERALANRVMCTCGYVSAPYLLRASAAADAADHCAGEYAAARSTGE